MKKPWLLLILTAALLSGCASQSFKPGSDWQLLYHHDAEGQPIAGDKQRLIQAVLDGRPIRVVWPIREHFIHVADAGFLTVMNGEVFAQWEGIVRQIPDRQTRRSIALDAKEQSQWHAIISTTGQLQSFQSVNPTLGSNQFTYKWYGFVAEQ